MSDATVLLGRDGLLARCRAALADGGGLLLTGPAGIGKSAVLDVLDAEAAEAGALVLRSNSTATEASLPHLALYDLLARTVADRDGLIAPHLRSVLDVALLRSPGDGRPTEQLAIRVAVLELLRSLAADRPVLLVLDDAHCLDPASAQVLGFAARRLRGQRVRVAAAERVAEGREPDCLDLLPAPRAELPVGTLPGPVIGELLRTRLGLPPTDRVSARIQSASDGNPFYALELARAALRSQTPVRTDEPLPVPERLRALLAGRLAALPREAVAALLLVAAAARAQPWLPAGDDRALGAALAAGVVTRGPGPELRFTHPLLREIIYADATPAQRRRCHAALADLLDDPLERARHRALATTGADPGLADELTNAARIAVERGAPALAAELLRTAAERTPQDPARPGGIDPADAAAIRPGGPGDPGSVVRRIPHDPAARPGTPEGSVTLGDLHTPGELGNSAARATPHGPGVPAGSGAPDARHRPGASGGTEGHPLSGLAAERLLGSARHALDAGLLDQAREACAAILRDTAPHPTPVTAPPNRTAPAPADPRGTAPLQGTPARGAAARVGALLLLVELAGGNRAGVPALLDAAEADAGEDPRLRAAVRLSRAEHAISTGRTGAGLAELAEAERQATRSGDVDQQLDVIALRAPIEMQLHRDRVLPSLRRATALAADRPSTPLTAAVIQIRCCLVVWLLRSGEVAEAVETVNRLRTDVENAGRVKDLGDVLHMVASVHERAGRCAEAYRAAVLGGRMRSELGTADAPALMLSAAAELNGGTAERAGELAAAAVRAAELAGDTEWAAYALGLRGRADLLGHRVPQAAAHLGRCRSLLRGLGYTDPALFLVDADLVEALARSGATDEARRVLSEAGREAARLDRQVVRLGLARAQAVLVGLDGDPRGAADGLRAALPSAHPYPLELARARLALGELERRARRRAAARADLRAAAGAFAAADCLPWLDHARERLARLDGPAPALSALERQIVELVESGLTNRRIAAELHVSVKSVEAGLTRLFRRFGVRDRSELTARRVAG